MHRSVPPLNTVKPAGTVAFGTAAGTANGSSGVSVAASSSTKTAPAEISAKETSDLHLFSRRRFGFVG